MRIGHGKAHRQKREKRRQTILGLQRFSEMSVYRGDQPTEHLIGKGDIRGLRMNKMQLITALKEETGINKQDASLPWAQPKDRRKGQSVAQETAVLQGRQRTSGAC